MIQNYPRDLKDLLDGSKLAPHKRILSKEEIDESIEIALKRSETKAKKEILKIGDDWSEDQIKEAYVNVGESLFKYWRKGYVCPATSAMDYAGKTYQEIAREIFPFQMKKKLSMNAGWFYQYLAFELARRSGRFLSITEEGINETDLVLTLEILNASSPLTIYMQIKNRVSTVSGSAWQGIIEGLEKKVIPLKNRTGPYIVVFGFSMDHGKNRKARRDSINCEFWLSDYYWKNLSNISYVDMAQSVGNKFEKMHTKLTQQILPDESIEAFGEEFKKYNLLLSDNMTLKERTILTNFYCGLKIK